jgi:GPI-anchor transamidase subunit K
LLSSSKFYFNYRHSLNVLMIYHYLKSVGITDDQILLMLPTDHGCNPRNPFPGTIYHEEEHELDWLCENVEVDYKGEDLTEETILNALRGRYDDFLPMSKRLNTNSESRIFVFFNGHGGENFFKIQDTELIHSEDLAKTFKEMHHKNLYKEMFFLIDTC